MDYENEDVERIARAFHDTYDARADEWAWEPQARTRVDWDDLPPNNRGLMRAVVENLLAEGIIRAR